MFITSIINLKLKIYKSRIFYHQEQRSWAVLNVGCLDVCNPFPGLLLVELVMSPIWPPIGQEQAASFPASGIRQTTHTVIREESLLKTDSGVCVVV